MRPFSRKYLVAGLLFLIVVAVFVRNGTSLLGSFDPMRSVNFRVQENALNRNMNDPLSVRNTLIESPDDAISVTRSGPKTYSYTPTELAAISKDKKSLLTQFKICASGKNASQITGIKFKMLSEASFSFIPYLDSQPLWKTEITDMLQGTGSAYDEKSYDVILDQPANIQSGGCRNFNLMATTIKPGGHYILPVILGVGSTTPVHFSRTNLTGAWVKNALTGDGGAYGFGYGAVTLFASKPGPLMTYKSGGDSIQVQELNLKDPPMEFAKSFSAYNTFSHPYQLDSFDIELKTNALDPIQADLFPRVADYSPFHNFPFSPLKLPVQTLTLVPNVPMTVSIGAKLDTMTRFDANIYLKLPAKSATYTIKITNIKGGGSVIDKFSGKPFASVLFAPIKIDVPGSLPPAFPPNYKAEDADGKYKGVDVLTQQAVSLNALNVFSSLQKTKYSVDEVMDDLKKEPKFFISLDLENYQNASPLKYNPLPLSMAFQSNAGASFTVRAKFFSPNPLKNAPFQDITVKPGVPFTLLLPEFVNSLHVNFFLLDLPKSIKSSYYIQPVINSLSVTYGESLAFSQNGKNIIIQAGAPVPLMHYDWNIETSKPVVMPFPLENFSFSGSGLFEVSSANIPPPYEKMVDLDQLQPGASIQMNQFCLMSNEDTQISKMVFTHMAHEELPFNTMKIEVSGGGNSGLSVLLEKSGWSKYGAVFPMSSNIPLSAGSNTCFSLEVQGVIGDSLENAFLDLVEIQAISTKSGKPIKTILKQGVELSTYNPLKGTQIIFL